MATEVQAFPKFEFIEKTHTYLLDDKQIPSVTQVLEDVRVIDYSHIPGQTREMALARGRYVHLLTQYADEDDLDTSTVKPEWGGYLDAWYAFRRDMKFFIEPGGIEEKVCHPQHRYGGTLDRRGHFHGSKYQVLLDIKTNEAQWWVRLQTAAYAACRPNPRSFLRLAVELHADGTYNTGGKLEFSGREFEADFQMFLACLSVYNVKRRFER